MNKNRKIALICVCIICVMLLCSCGGRQKIDTIYAEERGGCELKISSNKGGRAVGWNFILKSVPLEAI